jgi:hypothetical protein
MKEKYLIISGFLVLVIAGILAFGYGMATAAQAEPPAPVPQGPGVPYLDEWEEGPHSQAEKEAFVHWDADGEIPANCATCHSTTGYQDFLGADGSEAGKVDKAQPTGQVITCDACHNPTASTLDTVTFPSGVVITGLGGEARCMVCHQGRESKVSVDEKIEQFKATDPDEVPAKIKNADGSESAMGFSNIHYKAAAATLYGGQVMGGYQYDGKSYDFKNSHVENADTCLECHDSHTGEVKVETCQICHGEQVKTAADLNKIREFTSAKDYDGDGSNTEPILGEITGLQEALLKAIENYAKEVAGAEIKYDGATYPYFMGADGKAYPNWTARLLKAAYNYQFSVKDTGQYAHGPKYNVQLLYDSIEDINAASDLKTKTDMSKMSRVDYGHFDGSAMAFRDWDDTGTVPASCAKCHSASGLPQIFANPGATIVTDPTNKSLSALAQPVSNGFMCATCHDEESWPNRYFAAKVTFPSGKQAWFADADANLCLNCHQGRQSTSSVDAYLAAVRGADGKPVDLTKQPDKVLGLKDPAAPQSGDNAPLIGFRNPHYYAAGASLMGDEVQGAYQYANQKYSGRTVHPAPMDNCIACHNAHTLELELSKCATCHGEVKSAEDLKKWRKADDTVDYDGDGTPEGYGEELDGMTEALWAAITNYATTKAKAPIVYDAHNYPYFFNDLNANGEVDADEVNRNNGYGFFTAKLLRAAYNYQWVSKDPGAYAHNFAYLNQAVYDSIKDVGGNVTKMKRAAVTTVAPPEAPTPPAAP